MANITEPETTKTRPSVYSKTCGDSREHCEGKLVLERNRDCLECLAKMSAAMDLDLDPEPVASTSKSHDMDIDSPNGSPAPPVPPKTRPAHVPPALGKSQTMPAVLPSGNNHKGNTRPKLHSFFGNLKPRNLNRGEQSSSLVELPSKTSSPSKGKSKLKRNESAILEVPSPSSTSASNYNQHNYFPTTSPGHQAESLSAYVTAAFRWALSFLLLWTVLAVLRALVNDISERIHATSLQSRSALHECSRHFEQNCIPPRVSEWALREGLCDDWRICMEKDPRMVSRARIAAEILAEMIDAFVGGMGWKTLVRPCSHFDFWPT